MNIGIIAGIISFLMGVSCILTPAQKARGERSIVEINKTRRTMGITMIVCGVLMMVAGWVLSYRVE
jgi:hypothetical protein